MVEVVVSAAAMAAAALVATGWTAQTGSWKAPAVEGADSAEAAARAAWQPMASAQRLQQREQVPSPSGLVPVPAPVLRWPVCSWEAVEAAVMLRLAGCPGTPARCL